MVSCAVALRMKRNGQLRMLHLPRRQKIATNSMRGSGKAYDLRDNSGKKPTEEPEMSNNNSPRPVFNTRRSNGSRSSNQSASCPQPPQQEHSDQHEEIVSYFVDRWESLVNRRQKQNGENDYVVYREKSPNPKMKDFKKFDLEAFMSTYQHGKLINSVPSHPGGASNSKS